MSSDCSALPNIYQTLKRHFKHYCLSRAEAYCDCFFFNFLCSVYK